MAFSELKLREEYDSLEQLVIEEQQALWATHKETILALCIENEIPLYNIAAVKLIEAKRLLTRLIALSSEYAELDEIDKQNEAWQKEFFTWQEKFNLELQKAKLALITMHDEAYLSVADQYRKRNGEISVQTLLTMQDMTDLLTDDKFISDNVVTYKPFSLAELSTEEEVALRTLIEGNEGNDKTIFLAANYDGHWFYLLKEKGVWSVKDEQPFIDDEFGESLLTKRQAGMLQRSTILLNKLIGEGLYNDLKVSSTEEQDNNFDCGTRVVNAYRKQVDEDYQEQEHRDMLVEVLEKQLSQEEYEALPEQLFSEDIEFSEKIEHVIEATIATQDSGHEQFENYQTFVKNTVYEVINRRGFFANLQNKIPVQDLEKDLDIDLTNRSSEEIEEIDTDFAAALQEAECTKAGL
ncbi:hypothetical protein [Legionella tunisiensis]|uniref:hypothetical protein n=1 Tax=Legionella tunisiensis TaxID=1034944 RepID=UPI0002E92B15|nr:hypothetical protein [Legionella tunisiensis]